MPTPLQISYTMQELPTVAATLWQWGHSVSAWAFEGDLGAGKTTLIRAICAHLGVPDAVSSPTFSLVHEYRRPNDMPVFHMDWYRMRDADEVVNAGLEDLLLTPAAVSFIEWPERAPEILPRPHILITITSTGPESRALTAVFADGAA